MGAAHKLVTAAAVLCTPLVSAAWYTHNVHACNPEGKEASLFHSLSADASSVWHCECYKLQLPDSRVHANLRGGMGSVRLTDEFVKAFFRYALLQSAV
jgi:hypothetical protein